MKKNKIVKKNEIKNIWWKNMMWTLKKKKVKDEEGKT